MKGIKAPFFIAVETVCFDAPDPAIERAQRAVVDHRTFFGGPNFDDLVGAKYREDAGGGTSGCHFNQKTAWTIVAPRWRDAIMAVLH